MPALLAFDGDQYVALLEDLGAAADLTSLYAPGTRIQDDDLASLLEYAELLHALELDPMLRDELSNASMRELNHEHIFVLPLDAANGLDLDAQTPGLAAVAGELQKDARYCARVRELGQHYRADNPSGSLLHGDFYPGSVLATKRGIRVIDPEFAFPGPPEFDLGVLAAHLIFAGEPESAIDRIEAGVARPLDRALLRGFAGAELMRRLLGVAQLPLAPDTDLDQKRQWLALSCRWVAGS
jgi:5-methylthioribose kinase